MEEKLQTCPDLKVHILLSTAVLRPKDRQLMKELEEKYPSRFNILIIDPKLCLNKYPHIAENHTKILVVDDKYFFVGGSPYDERASGAQAESFGSEQFDRFYEHLMPERYQDADAFGRGALAETLRDQFFRLYALWEYRLTGEKKWRFVDGSNESTTCDLFDRHPKKCKGVKARVLVSGPEHSGYNPIVSKVKNLVKTAKKNVRISGLYFNPDREFIGILENKKTEGVRTVGYFGNDDADCIVPNIFFKTNRRELEHLSAAHLFSDNRFLYHKKAGTADGERGWIGSCNFSHKSLRVDHELTIFFEDRKIARQIDEGFKEDRANSKPFKKDFKHYVSRTVGDAISPFVPLVQ